MCFQLVLKTIYITCTPKLFWQSIPKPRSCDDKGPISVGLGIGFGYYCEEHLNE